MAPTNVIINGDFSSGRSNWSGTDVEINPEFAFLGNGSRNLVSELDGRSGFTTVLEQTFTLDDAHSGILEFDTALRTASLGNAGTDGFTVEIVDSDGIVISTMTVLPTEASFTTIIIDVDFPEAGDYTLRFTEIGVDDSLGAIVDNISLLICFCQGTLIDTEHGEIPVEQLKAGDLVMTQSGAKALKWVGRRHVSKAEMTAEPKLLPIRIAKGALGQGMPHTDLLVSRQHRMQASSPVAERMFGAREVLISAIRLTALPEVEVEAQACATTYFHLLFDDHEIVFANGAPSESMLLSPMSLSALSAEALEELHLLFPGLTAVTPSTSQQTIPQIKQQKRFVERLGKNNKHPLDQRAH